MKDHCGKGKWSLTTDQVLFIERQPKRITSMGTLRVVVKIDVDLESENEISVWTLRKSGLGKDDKVDDLSY